MNPAKLLVPNPTRALIQPSSAKLRSDANPGSASLQRINFLDRWRALAVLSVFGYHCFGIAFGRYQPPWGNWFPNFHVAKSYLALLPMSWGWVGVPIFFVISGFCIHVSFRQRPDWRTFFYHRFFRIYPPYFIAFLVFATILPVTRLQRPLTAEAEQVASHLLLIHNFGSWSCYAVNPSFWTIAVEAQLYLLYPLLLLLVRKLGWRNALIGLAAIEVSLRSVQAAIFSLNHTLPPEWLSLAPFSCWFSWATGAAVAESYLNGEVLPFRGWPVLGLAALGIICTMVRPLLFMSFLVCSVATAAAMAKRLSRPNRTHSLLPPFLREHLNAVGLRSYSIYLLHQPFLFVAAWLIFQEHVIWPVHPLQIFAICVACWIPILAIGNIYFRFCERPSVQLGKFLQTLRLPIWAFRPAGATPDLS